MLPENPALDNLQLQLAQKLDFAPAHLYKPEPGHIMYTLDVAYQGGAATVGVDIVTYPAAHVATLQYRTQAAGQYQPGYFAFYEGPVIIEAVTYAAKLHAPPNLVIVDGHGLAHPRKFGLACYVGGMLQLPCIGLAKSTLLHCTNTLPAEKESTCPILLHGETVGVAYRSQKDINPIFISAGNKIDLLTSIEVIKQLTTTYRLPDNLRRADRASKQ